MDVTFGKTPSTPVVDTTATPAPVSEPAPPVTPTTQLPAVQKPGAVGPSGMLLGDYIPEFKDIILPRINIVQNIGQLKDSFPSGALVLNQQVVLFTPPRINAKTQIVETPASPPVSIVVLGFRPTRYCEKIEGGVRGLIVDTEDQVRANGGTLDYAEWQMKKASGMKRFEPLADAFVAIQKPLTGLEQEEDAVFVYDVDGKKYALALWGMRGTSYTAAAKRVFFTARAIGCLREGGYPSWQFAVTTREETYPGGNKAWIPVCLPERKTTPEFLTFATRVLNAPAQEAKPTEQS